MHSSHPYDALTPEVILTAVETFGMRCDGGFLALNSYENRVYRVETDAGPRVAKFYRPGRWSDATILEEHTFALHLAAHEIPVVAPLNHDERTLHEHEGFRFALFPWQPGRAPELTRAEDFRMLGRYVGRLHQAGRATPFQQRPRITIAEFGERSLATLMASEFLSPELVTPLKAICELALTAVRHAFDAVADADIAWRPLHGDLHLGNILWGAHGPHLVDFDDCLTGPAVQDLWMLLSGERAEMEQQLADILAGYTQFAPFNALEIRLLEPLRTLRILRYNAWLAERWADPAFPRNFPWFNTQRHWQDQILALREQLALLDEPPLHWTPE